MKEERKRKTLLEKYLGFHFFYWKESNQNPFRTPKKKKKKREKKILFKLILAINITLRAIALACE